MATNISTYMELFVEIGRRWRWKDVIVSLIVIFLFAIT